MHFLSKSFELYHYLLETREFPTTHSGANIADEVECVLKEWDIKMNTAKEITTDNRANITSVVQMLGLIHVAGFSHTLQLAVKKVLKLPAVVKAVAQCRHIVTQFHHSSKSSYQLKEKQISLGHKQHYLIQDVATQWNLAYYMINRIMEQQQSICATLLAIHKGEFQSQTLNLPL